MRFDDFDTQVQCEESGDLELFEIMEDERAYDLDSWAESCEPDWSDLADHLDMLERQRIAANAAERSQMWEDLYAEIRKNGKTWIS